MIGMPRCSRIRFRTSERLVSNVLPYGDLFFELRSGPGGVLIGSANRLLLEFFRFVCLLVVVLHHFPVGFGVDRWLARRLLGSWVLQLHCHLRLLVLPTIIPQRLFAAQLLPSPPQFGLLAEVLKLANALLHSRRDTANRRSDGFRE